jgi:hypothetical protein
MRENISAFFFTFSNMSNNTSSIVSKVWSFCNVLRDDGVGYGDYLEQLTFLLFLKMADEYSKPPYNRDIKIPAAYNWESLVPKRGAELEAHYVAMLRELGKEAGMLGARPSSLPIPASVTIMCLPIRPSAKNRR